MTIDDEKAKRFLQTMFASPWGACQPGQVATFIAGASAMCTILEYPIAAQALYEAVRDIERGGTLTIEDIRKQVSQ